MTVNQIQTYSNKQIARLLREVAAAYSIDDEVKHHYQIIAYERAADIIENATSEFKDLWKEDKLIEVGGIGASMASYIDELFKTGRVLHFEEIKKGIPPAVYPLINIPHMGPKNAYKLVNAFKFHNPDTVIEDLHSEAKKGTIANVPTFGEKSQSIIMEAINEYKMGKSKNVRMPLPFASEIANKMLEYLMKCPAVFQAEPLGSLRRKVATIGDIDIAVASDKPEEVIAWFINYHYKEKLIEAGDNTASILTSGGRQIDLMVQPPAAFGSLLQHFTGSKAHNIHLRTVAQNKGMSLSEYGIKTNNSLKQFKEEEDFYEAIGLQWVPPEMREDTGEIELAQKHQLPNLVKTEDIKGDLHIHSSFNIESSHDIGANSIEEILKKAERLNYSYVGFADHNPSVSKHSQIEIYNIIKARNDLIEQNKQSTKSVQILKLLEVDILSDGNLAITEDALSLLDAAIVSIHSSFNQDIKNMTSRILKGLSHPKARILAHPTGRLINQRTGYEADWLRILGFCKENNKAVEINAWPSRLDLPDTLVREAVKMDVKIVINTDSHATSQMDVMKFGVSVARRGWATKNNILNTLSFDKFKTWLNDV